MKKIFIPLLLTGVVACTTGAPQQFYRPAGASEQLVISGNFNQLSYEHKVMINNELALSGQLPYNGDDASFAAQYKEMNITSDCHWRSKTDLRCLVKINGENAANLAF